MCVTVCVRVCDCVRACVCRFIWKLHGHPKKVSAISETQNFAWNIHLQSLNCGKIGESHSRSLGRFTGRIVDRAQCLMMKYNDFSDGLKNG